MGIQHLTSFVKNYFACWDHRRVRGPLVVDGNSVVHSLHGTMEWSNGGQYPEYRRAVRKFYSTLQRSNIKPIVIFDGVDYEEQKTDTLLKRRQDWVNTIHKRITNNTSRPNKCSCHILPLLSSEVYRMVLHGLGIPFYVADGEADLIIARVANHYECPVLSQDSDFFVFRLVGGYIPFDHFYWQSSIVMADVYQREKFADQLKFQDSNLFCAIPAIVGNDFLLPCSPSFVRSILDSLPDGVSFKNNIRSISLYLSKFSSLESYATSAGKKQEVRCKQALEWYSVPNSLSCGELVESTILRHRNGSKFPHWLIRLFHQGHVPSALLEAAINVGKVIFHMVPDNFQKQSSIVAGQIIRQYMYAMLECKEVVEVYRQSHGLSLISVNISSRKLSGEFENVTVSCLPSVSHQKRRQLFFTIMQCDKQACRKLVEEYHDWQFVAATVSLWAKTTGVSPSIVKVLLLCFMICSGLCDEKVNSIRHKCILPLEFRQSQGWLDIMHSFAQWQVIYHTAWTLNALLMEPMAVFSPAFLYDGQIAMYLASVEQDIDQFTSDIDMTLYARLKEAVLGSVNIP